MTMNMMTQITTLAVREIESEGRVLDTDLGAALGMARPTNIRTLIKEHMEALVAFGNVALTACDVAMPNGGTKLGTAYWLNEEQATYVTMHLRTPKAQAVKVEIVKVFTAWRRGSLVPAQPAPIAIPQNLSEALRLAADEHDRANREEGLKLIAQAQVEEMKPLAAVGEPRMPFPWGGVGSPAAVSVFWLPD